MTKKILITNDDGLEADGIIRLAEVAKEFGEVWVVAPDSQRSAMSHSITLRHKIKMWEVDFPVEGVHAYASDGTPADCVRVGVLNIVPGKPDYVFSGINNGYNVASDIQYSATAGAAFEASFQKIHSIAFSEDITGNNEVTGKYIREVIEKLINLPLNDNEIFNVNFPGCSLDECKGIIYNRTVSRKLVYEDHYDEEDLGNGEKLFQVVGELRSDAEEGTDLEAVNNHYVSVGIATNIH